jgi:hypothetical protein
MTNELVIFPHQGAWMVERVGDAETFELFGTTVLPTAFTSIKDVRDVIQVLDELNPGCSIDWFPSHDAWLTEVRSGDEHLARMAGVR